MNITSRLHRLEQRLHPQEPIASNQQTLLILSDPQACALACALIAEVSNNPDTDFCEAAAELEARLEEVAA